MADKPLVGFYWCSACGGCEESVVDLAEDLLPVLDAVEFVLFPVAMDFKREDVEALDDGVMLAAMINGCVRTSEQEDMAELLRRKAKVLVAVGSCACQGGIPSLANQFDREQILRFVYEEAPTLDKGAKNRPAPVWRENGHAVTLPEFHGLVRSLDQVVDVDYYLPGCPPPHGLIKQALEVLLSGELPPKGSVIGPDTALCDECPRKATKPADLRLTEFKRPHWTEMDPDRCLMAQGIVCMGPATRGGCDAACVRGNMPCSGCSGPTSRVRDQGAKILSSIASTVSARESEDIETIMAGIPDPVGTFYRYGMARSLLRGKVRSAGEAGRER